MPRGGFSGSWNSFLMLSRKLVRMYQINILDATSQTNDTIGQTKSNYKFFIKQFLCPLFFERSDQLRTEENSHNERSK